MSIFSQVWKRISGDKSDEKRKKDPQSRKARLEALEERQLLTVVPGPMPETALVAETLAVTNDDALVTTEALGDSSPADGEYSLVGTENGVANTTSVDYLDYDVESGKFVQKSVVATVVDSPKDGGWTSGWYVVKGIISMENADVWCNGDVHLILEDGCKLTIRAKEGKSGFAVSGNTSSSLTIYGQSDGADVGELHVTGGNEAAGIGGVRKHDGDKGAIGRDITINGGKVYAQGGARGAGIGGGYEGSGYNITINGGFVEARGGTYGDVENGDGGAGIGGGNKGSGTNITIRGGEVRAIGGANAAGIGGGEKKDGENITITDGTVEARGGYRGAGIGGGGSGNVWISAGDGKNITISNGTVRAFGGDGGGAGIGGGEGRGGARRGYGRNISITGGTVTAQGGKGGCSIGDGNDNQGKNITIYRESLIKTGSDSGSARAIVNSGGDLAGELCGGDQKNRKNYVSIVPKSSQQESVYYIDENGKQQQTIATVVEEWMNGAWKAGWYVVKNNVKIENSSIWCNGDVRLILTDRCNLTINGRKGACGIAVAANTACSLTIYAQSVGNEVGELHATGGYEGAGIGGDKEHDGRGITINGGKVYAKGGDRAAGIGGAYEHAGYNITINGGIVYAYGGDKAAGIGGGCEGSGYNIKINNGEVKAYGYNGGAGIGGGNKAAGKDISIYNGIVYASGVEGAGIGGGYKGIGEGIVIEGGVVTADGNDGGAGIGGGAFASCGRSITISGGVVKATSGTKKSGSGNEGGAGIGGGYKGDGIDITIEKSAIVTAIGGEYGAGIGGGGKEDGKNINIKGGTVTATGGIYAAGIGGGGTSNGSVFGGSGGDGVWIMITGGNVKAYGGSGGGAGIGGGNAPALGRRGKGNHITIENATVEAWGGALRVIITRWGCGIGDGNGKAGSDIKVSTESIIKVGKLFKEARLIRNDGGDLGEALSEDQKTFIVPKKISTPVLEVKSTDSSITVSWKEDERAKDYEIAWRRNENDVWTVVDERHSETSFEFSHLECSTTYYFRVKANPVTTIPGEDYIASDYAYAKGTTLRKAVESVSISGRACVGEMLTATNICPLGATATLTWYRKSLQTGTITEVGTGESYTVQKDDYGYVLTVKATGNGNYGGEVFSEPTGKVLYSVATPDLKATGTTDDSLAVEWNAVENAKGYVVEYRSKAQEEEEWTALPETTALNQLVKGLTRNTEYVIRVQALATRESGWLDSNYATLTATTAKTALTSVSISGTAEVGATLTATVEPEGAEATYAWYRSGETASITTGATYTITTADVGAVLTVKATGTGDYTGEVSATTEKVPAFQLTKPDNFAAIATTDDSIAVSWNEVENASGYQIEYRVKGSKSDWTVLDLTDATLNIDGLKPNTTYRVRVRAIDADSHAESDYVKLDVTTEKAALTSVSIGGTAEVGATLTATVEPGDATASYAWYRSGESEPVGTGATYAVTTADVGAFLTVKAIGTGDYTGVVFTSTEVSASVQQLAKPKKFKATSTTDDSITVSWKAVANASAYQVEYRVKGSGKKWTVLETTDMTITIDGLKSDKTYRIRVKALGSGAYFDSAYAKLDATTNAAIVNDEDEAIPTGTVASNAWNLSGFVGVVAPVAAIEVAQVETPTFAKAGKIASDVRSDVFATLGEDEFDAFDLDVAFDALV